MQITNFRQVDVIHSAEGINNVDNMNSVYKVLKSSAYNVSTAINEYQLRRLSIKE